MRARPIHIFVVMMAYVGLIGWLTWPLPAHIGDRLPNTNRACSMDGLQSAWVLAYQTHALTTDPREFPDANIFHPARRALFYGQTATGAVPYFALPFVITGNAAAALNCTFLAGAILTAVALHLVLMQWTASHAAAFLGAMTFLTTPWVLWGFAPSAPQYSLLQYLPFIILLTTRPRLSTGATIALAVLVALQALVDVLYVAVAVLVPLGLLALGAMIAGGDRRAKGWRLLWVMVFSALCILPIHLAHWAVRLDNPGLGKQTLWSFGQLPVASLRGLRQSLSPTAVSYLALALIGIGMLVHLSVPPSTRISRRAWVYAGFFAVAGLVLSLKPPGHTDATFGLLGKLMAFDLLRVPLRLGVVGLIGLCLLVGLGFAEIERALARKIGTRRIRMASYVATLVVAIGMYQEQRHGDPISKPHPLPSAYPLQPVSAPESAVLAVLRNSDGPLLELPVGKGVFDGAHDQALAMYRSTYHWHRLLNGYDGYWPSGFPERMTLARRLPDAGALEKLHRDTGLQLVLVRVSELDAGERAKWLVVAGQGGVGRLRLAARGTNELLFSVAPQ